LIKILLKMKRKIMYLTLTFCILGMANVKSQVTIGSNQNPQSGAVLDLSKVSDQDLGFLLPQVWLKDVTEWQLRGSDSTNGVGMLIYNINPNTIGGNGKTGLYFWTGTDGWEPLRSNLSDVVQVDSFDLTPSGNINIYVGETVSFSVFNFMPVNAAYQGVIWAIPEGTEYARINTESKTMVNCTVTGLSVGTATLTVTSLDNNVKESVTVNVKVCTSAPDAPTGITFSKTTGIKLNEEITATATPEVKSGGAKPMKYNWIIPGDYFDVISGTNDRIITLKAKAAATSITNTIKVNAENDCGKSADYSNATALSIVDCTTAPATPGSITVPASVVANKNFTVSIASVSGATSYTWNVPSNLTVVSGQNTIEITCKANSAGAIAAGAITVTASNDCGTSAAQSSASAMTVIPACSGYTIANGEFSGPATTTTLSIGDDLSAILSKGFSATGKSLCLAPYDQRNPSSYNWVNGMAQCTSLATDGASWRMPNIAELANLQSSCTSYGMSLGNYGCSTERNSLNAWFWRYNQGSASYGNKTFTSYVRCVRSLL
jgi:hypothetical protein